jgi:cell surface protein SprA
MKTTRLHRCLFRLFGAVLFLAVGTSSAYAIWNASLALQVDSPQIDLHYPIIDPPSTGDNNTGTIDLGTPSNVTNDVVYDPVTGQYVLRSRIGENIDYRPPQSMSLDEYMNYDMQKAMKTYWMEKNQEESERAAKSLIPSIQVRNETFCRIFGGCNIDIRPQGSAEVTFGVNTSKTENPRIPVDQRKITTFNFDQKIQLNLVGNIGTKLKINTSYNTEATFDFENQVKLNYAGNEDDIIQKLEAGNVSLPLTGQLIQGSQSLFGLKTELRFGKLTATAIFSQEKGQRKNIAVAGGAQTTNFLIKADEYEANKYYFLSYYFRDNYENALRTLPTVNSGIQVTKVEVWVTNTRSDYTNNRNIVAFTDLGEDASPASVAANRVSANLANSGLLVDGPGNTAANAANNLYQLVSSNAGIRSFTNAAATLQVMGMQASRNYEKLESARLLSPNEYTLNEKLGFIGLNQNLNNDEVLAVAYQYTYQGQTYQVGEFSTDGIAPPNALMLRLLKATITDPRLPLWDLMMKNVYSLGAFQVNPESFRLELLYNNPTTGVDLNYIPKPPIDQIPLLQALGLDRLDQQGAPNPDGWFDWVDNAATTGGTINSQNGRIFFPVLEPFGSYLNRKLIGPNPGAPVQDTLVRKNIVFQQLYDSTKTAAENLPELNRFKLKGSFKSASSDVISLNSVNIPQGSVSVTAGGVKLVENQDYTVDYNLGRVKILNQGILESGTPINISLESNSLFSIQTKTLAGARFDYKVNKDLVLGGTVMNLYERPLTQKVNVGDEPIANTILGLDANWKSESGFITRLVDKLPFFGTKETSAIDASAEAAYLIPGHSKAIGNAGTSYIDDFEGSVSNIDMRTQSQWFMAPTPQGQTGDLFPEGEYINDLRTGFKRALLAWYVIDPLFFNNNSLKPPLPDGSDTDNRSREVLEKEVFPNRQLATGTPSNIPVLDLAYYPSERGPYNYNTNLDANGDLPDPEDNWAGIERRVTTTDFEASNIETVQFWLMDPFSPTVSNADGEPASNVDANNTTGGDLYINLGNLSEDVLRDSRKSFENGLPKSPSDLSATTAQTSWGVVPTTQSVVNAFAITDQNTYRYQDVGMDGLSNTDANAFQAGLNEQTFFQGYLNALNPGARTRWQGDPSGDDYAYFRGNQWDSPPQSILARYKRYNGLEGNSITDEDSPESYPTQATTLPTTEDINQDQNLSESESYFQYRVKLRPANMVVGQNFITDRILGVSPSGKQVYWYQFKVPVRQPEKAVNGIQDFRSIRFMRLFVKGWAQPVVLRFARLDFVRGEWRKYTQSLEAPGEVIGGDPDQTTFDVAAVNIEENGNRVPINYVLPPGINQETDIASANLRSLNEQSLELNTCGLRDGDARAAFRNVNFDIRSYKKLRMYVHAESADPAHPIVYGDISVFIRLGNDYEQNYYEYEVPAKPSPFYSNDPDNVWPDVNNMIIEFAKLNDIKIQRNQAGFPVNQRYTQMDGDRRVTVVGNPNLSQMNTIMIGIRNPKKDGDQANPWVNDDGSAKCVEVWVNELRLTDFDQRGGWAAIARVNTTLADLGTLSVAGNYSTPGWGGIDKKVSERQRDTRYGIDVSANLEMSKFLPEKSGVKVPMYLGYSEQIINPQYDPLNPDIEWNDATRSLTREEKKARLKELRTYTRRRSINFTNIHKDKAPGNKTEHFFDVSNFGLSYAYSDQEFHDVNTQYENTRTYRGSLNYQHNPKARPVKPFENVAFIGKSKWLKLIKDFNFNFGFKQITARTAIDRSYLERLIRPNPDITSLPPTPTYNKSFNWTNQYGFRYDVTKNLKVDFTANNNSIIGEPAGRVNADDHEEYQVWKDSVLASLRHFGETTTYNHTVNITYTLPLDKLPATDWITANATYGAGYQWDRAPLTQDTVGNTIQNSRNINLNGQFNFVNLYNKIKYFKKINDKARSSGGRPTAKKGSAKDNKGAKDKEEDKDAKGTGPKINPLEGLARLLMTIRTGTLTYTQNSGILLPGWGRSANAIGMDPSFTAPGLGFLLGEQNQDLSGNYVRDFAGEAAGNGWLVQTPSIFNPYTNTRTETINGRLSLEPFKSVRIELLATRTQSENRSSFFRWNATEQRYVNDSPREFGNFSVSTINWGTTFARDDENFVNSIFTQMLANRPLISERLGRADPRSMPTDSLYWAGYGSTSQDVVIGSFMAAYTGKSADKVQLNPFKLLPLPNWDITYDGLTKLDLFKKLFRTFTVKHSYRSTFNIGGYQTNLLYEPGGSVLDAGGNFLPERQIQVVTISEVMHPFINFDATLQNSLLAKFEYNRDRNLSLGLTNFQVTEVRGKEYVIGSGYRFKNVKFPFQLGGKTPKSDLNLRLDFSWRQNNTVIRKLQEEQNQVTAGSDIISMKASADYTIDQRLNLRAFYERVINKPVISTSFPSANTNIGISLRFTLTQ